MPNTKLSGNDAANTHEETTSEVNTHESSHLSGNYQNNQAQTKQWQRLSPIAILFFAMSFIQGLFGQLIYIAPALIIGYKQITENPTLWLPIVITLLTVLAISAVLKFYYFQYRLSKNTIEIRAGVFKKSHTNLPFSRIQNVKLEQPIYYRLTGYACLQLDTAGSSKQEVKIAALPLAFAEALKKEILAQHEKHNNEDCSDDKKPLASTLSTHDTNLTSAQQETLLNTRSVKDLIIHGVTSNRIWIFLGASAPFFDNAYAFINEKLSNYGINLAAAFDLNTHSWLEVGLYALTITFLMMFALTLFSILGSVMTFYGYTLSKVGDKYIRRSGLFTKHEVTMRLSRLQMIIQKQDWLDMVLKRINLKFEQSGAKLYGASTQALNNKIMVPSITPEQSLQLINEVYPENNLSTVNFTAISKHFLVRYLAYMLLPLFAFCQSTLLYTAQYELAASLIVPFVFIGFLIVMRWYRWGYASDEHFIYVRKGYVGVDYYCFPIYKVQQTTLKQSIMMEKSQLATTRFILAAGTITIPYLSQNAAYQLLNKTLMQVESSDKSWM
ncbi:PH domain-containing protein [Colwellia sp. D2M02]|uniref:PH domain-containing protein n=1 Tax=Colwellia sp. D2M02 TaxID=2841562 RepID=UPI001C082011|nr:PH domain-containing protein [Colwellia sp. D2M02]MBU2892756.1 PH domain-containing protein [Colwellia sp. D2M02]